MSMRSIPRIFSSSHPLLLDEAVLVNQYFWHSLRLGPGDWRQGALDGEVGV